MGGKKIIINLHLNQLKLNKKKSYMKLCYSFKKRLRRILVTKLLKEKQGKQQLNEM
jgi:hypothetical protein